MLKFINPNYDQIKSYAESIKTNDIVRLTSGSSWNTILLSDKCDKSKVKYLLHKDCIYEEDIHRSYQFGVLPVLTSDNIMSMGNKTFYFPKKIVPNDLGTVLNILLNYQQTHKDVSILPIVGFFTFNDMSNKNAVNKLCPVKRYVYKFQNKLFINIPCFHSFGGNHIINEHIYSNGDFVWLTVEPLCFNLVTGQGLIPDSVLFGGIPYNSLQVYLDNYFQKEITQFSDLKLDDEKTSVKYDHDSDKIGKMNILNLKNFQSAPTIGRNAELEMLEVTLAQDLKIPILVGESGVGKTAIIDELAYRIQMGNVPSFLKDQLLVEINPFEVVADTKYRGEFEKKLNDIITFCTSHNAIMVINEVHTIFGVGSSSNDANDMAEMLKMAIDREGLRIIGSTTKDEYEKVFASSALKRRFKKIAIDEPTDEMLYVIIKKVIEDYANKQGISSQLILQDYPSIIDIIINLTKKNHRTYDDIENNPSLSVDIIDTAFGYAKYYNSEILKLEHFEASILSNDRLYDSAKKEAIDEIKNLSVKNHEPIKILKKL